MPIATTTELLDTAYKELGYAVSEEFLDSADKVGHLNESDCIEKLDWLKLAKEVKAEKVFFLNNNPVAIFARHDSEDITTLRKLYNNIWCMARPRLLFLAKPGELTVYDLAFKPSQTDEEWLKSKNKRALATAESIDQVASELKKFHREQLESGRVFEDSEVRFGDINNRADKALIRDLKAVRQKLMDNGLKDKKLKYAHALIGRSIFIRYLEDRGILISDDFYDVAKGHADWERLLEEPSVYANLDCSESVSLYLKVLGDKDFTFALFRKLAKDFNGDMFPSIDDEEKAITETHLDLIRDLLCGNTGPEQNLFFYAYQFKIIPIELISSIYEEFYHKEAESKSKKKKSKANPQGAFYTPPALVEFLLSQVLTPERLSADPPPRILDPACGSGIFLVESFRRIVRYRAFNQKRRLSFNELRKILREQLFGIDIEPEAIRVAAFSLYLAMLHYLNPPSIREQIKKGNRLPNLVFDERNEKEDNYNTLLVANAFNDRFIRSSPILKKNFLSGCADIIVGNPPWGSPGRKKTDASARKQNETAISWCEKRKLPIGDGERSQSFIWRTLDILKSDGVAGLLVSTGVFFKHHPKSVEFRKKWLDTSAIVSVFNFAHTRKVFFKGATSPFAAVVFKKSTVSNQPQRISYWSSKKTRTIETLHSVVFSGNDLKLLRDEDDLSNYKTWKTFWWGNQQDSRLIRHLSLNDPLGHYTSPMLVGQGYKKANKAKDSDWLKDYEALPDNCFKRYGRLNFDLYDSKETPCKVESRGSKEIYSGTRLLIQRGINEGGIGPKGQIIARLENKEFCFTNALHGLKLSNPQSWKYRILLGILWSSVARYYFFMTTSNWGIWHDEIHLKDELLKLPVCFPEEKSLRKRILSIVDKLRTYDPIVKVDDLFEKRGVPEEEIEAYRRGLESELDDAIFELYGLGEAEIDLIHDMCDTNLAYFYSPDKSLACQPVLNAPLKKNYGNAKRLPDGIGDYLKVFIQCWNPYLDKGTKLCWSIHQPDKTDSMIAVVFSIYPKTAKQTDMEAETKDSWNSVLERLNSDTTHHFGSSRVFIEGFVRTVSNDQFIIIKRNQVRLWTKSMAREDAEATLVQAMNRAVLEEMDVCK